MVGTMIANAKFRARRRLLQSRPPAIERPGL